MIESLQKVSGIDSNEAPEGCIAKLAKEHDSSIALCNGCCYNTTYDCLAPKGTVSCFGGCRKDGCNVIFVKVEE